MSSAAPNKSSCTSCLHFANIFFVSRVLPNSAACALFVVNCPLIYSSSSFLIFSICLSAAFLECVYGPKMSSIPSIDGTSSSSDPSLRSSLLRSSFSSLLTSTALTDGVALAVLGSFAEGGAGVCSATSGCFFSSFGAIGDSGFLAMFLLKSKLPSSKSLPDSLSSNEEPESAWMSSSTSSFAAVFFFASSADLLMDALGALDALDAWDGIAVICGEKLLSSSSFSRLGSRGLPSVNPSSDSAKSRTSSISSPSLAARICGDCANCNTPSVATGAPDGFSVPALLSSSFFTFPAGAGRDTPEDFTSAGKVSIVSSSSSKSPLPMLPPGWFCRRLPDCIRRKSAILFFLASSSSTTAVSSSSDTLLPVAGLSLLGTSLLASAVSALFSAALPSFCPATSSGVAAAPMAFSPPAGLSSPVPCTSFEPFASTASLLRFSATSPSLAAGTTFSCDFSGASLAEISLRSSFDVEGGSPAVCFDPCPPCETLSASTFTSPRPLPPTSPSLLATTGFCSGSFGCGSGDALFSTGCCLSTSPATELGSAFAGGLSVGCAVAASSSFFNRRLFSSSDLRTDSFSFKISACDESSSFRSVSST
mmetsp:Transcript_53322/g.108784  ORF Transcript_53322/g.108784 Transcript_53322/m.108784 type:complete len:593 (-) Transcript_53322:520-2298(-)